MPEGDEGDIPAGPPILAAPGGGTLTGGLGGTTFTAPGPVTVSTPPPKLVTLETYLDCSFKSARLVLPCPGCDKLHVFVEPVTAAIGAAILKIKAGSDENAAAAVGVDVTSTGSTQTQTELGITGKPNAYVEVSTVQADLTIRVVMTAMKA